MDGGIADWIARRAQRQPGAVALVDVATGVRLTYADLDRRVGARAAALAALGIEAGARVALLGENSAAYLEWLFGAARLGAIAVPINHRLSPGEVAHVLTDSGAAVLVRSTAFTGLAGDALDVTGAVPVVELGEEPGDRAVAARPVAGDDPCVIMYTSGTTGVPKGAVLTHDNMLWNAINMAVAGPGIGGTDITVAAAPLFHIGALGLSALPLLYAGGTVVVVPSFDPAAFVDLLAREGVTTQFLVPAMWAALTRLPSLPPLPALRWAISGGAPCPVTVIEYFTERGWTFTEGFGMTELSPAALFLDADDVLTHAGSVGRPFMHVEARLVSETGEDVGVGEVGELVLRGPTVFAGYWNRPEATAEALRTDPGEHADRGWFRSGDLGVRDAEGFVTLVDRKKDMIITGGENVYPIEVEQVLHRHPAIADVAVVGVGDPQWGETVLAVVVASGEINPAEVIAYARERIAHFKAPRRVEVVDELPRNATGKLLKRVLREQFAGQASAVAR